MLSTVSCASELSFERVCGLEAVRLPSFSGGGLNLEWTNVWTSPFYNPAWCCLPCSEKQTGEEGVAKMLEQWKSNVETNLVRGVTGGHGEATEW
jgi:hypothetical protein